MQAVVLALAEQLDAAATDDIAKLNMAPEIAQLPAGDPRKLAHSLVAKRARKRIYNRMTRTFERGLS